MKNKHSDGYVANVVLSGTVASGDVVIQGDIIGIAVTDGVSGDTIAVNIKGAYSLTKKSALAITQGDKVYWDATPGEVTKTEADGVLIGSAFEDAAGGDATVIVLLSRPANTSSGIVPQATATPIGTLTEADATGNTTGDINGVKNGLLADINTVATKVDSLITKLEAAGVLV